jgi:hypothetical protein
MKALMNVACLLLLGLLVACGPSSCSTEVASVEEADYPAKSTSASASQYVNQASYTKCAYCDCKDDSQLTEWTKHIYGNYPDRRHWREIHCVWTSKRLGASWNG